MDMAPQERAEALKILGKRQRRVGKVEDCGLDIEQLFHRQKRFCPSNLELDSTPSDVTENNTRLQLPEKTCSDLNKKLVNSIIEQLQESDTSYQQLPTLLK
jgi:hypothetical protein